MTKTRNKLIKTARVFWAWLVVAGYQNFLKPFSRISRKLFEAKLIKRIYGLFMVMVVITSTMLPSRVLMWKNNRVSSVQAQTISSTALVTEKSIRLPVEDYRVTQKYGLFHPGIDLASGLGNPIHSVMDGVVITVKHDRTGYGNHVIVDHGSGIQSLYAHMAKIMVGENEVINRERIIGTIGSTGHSTGPHLHLQIWQEEKWVNPERFLEDYLETQIEKPSKPEVPKLAKK